MTNDPTTRRKAFSLAEFAQMVGRHRSWAYRQAKEGRIKTITGFGTTLVPAHEIDRILGADPQIAPLPTGRNNLAAKN
ncbi:MAG: hypothetical protein WCK77_14525 [Verrucomicrobiota bacterium]